MDLARSLDSALARICSSGRVEVRENGAWLAVLENFAHSVREDHPSAILHLWSPDGDQVRRVNRIISDQPDCLAIEVSRLGRTRPTRLEFLTSRKSPPALRLAREQFRSRFQQILAENFPDETVASLTTAPDLEHSISGNYVRGTVQSGSTTWAIMAAAPSENPSTYDGLLTFGLIWLEKNRNSLKKKTLAGLRLFFPEGAGRTAAHRSSALSSSVKVELHEYSAETGRVKRCDSTNAGNVESWLSQRRETEAALESARAFLDYLRDGNTDAIQAYPITGTGFLDVRYRGLTFARWQPDAVFFGAGDPQRLLSAGTQSEFDRLLKNLKAYRSPSSDHHSHPLYRATPERWLESIIAADPSRVDARLDARFIYSQVPALSIGERGVMDLLGVTRDGRLTVLELKAQEDIHLPLQAVDYWLRVRWHQAREEFARYGYFPGITLDPRPPRLLLIAPSLRFHPAMDIVLKYLSPEIEIERIGLSEYWRRGIKVVLRQGLAASA
jgi:hypothetical protein